MSIFCQKLPFLPQNAWFFFLKSKNGVLETFLKSDVLCTKILGTVKFFLKSKNLLKSNVLKSKIHCSMFILDSRVCTMYIWVSSEQFLWHFFNSYLFPLRPYVMKNLIKNLRNTKDMNTSLIWISTQCESYCFIAAKEHWPTFRVIDSVYEEVYTMD